MKKHLIFVSIALLTIVPVKLLGMEEENQDPQKILAVKKLYNLAGIGPTENPSNFENVLKKLFDFSNTTDDCTKLREGIIAITPLFAIWKEQNSPQIITLKKLRTSLYNRLVLLLLCKKQLPTEIAAKLAAKDFCYGVIDDISDDETNKEDNYTQNNFNKYKDITGKILNIEIHNNQLNESLSLLNSAQKTNNLDIQKLANLIENIKHANDEMNKKITGNKEEIDVLTIAHKILENKSLHQFKKMQQQREWLVKEINFINNYITNPTKESSTSTDEIKTKNEKIKNNNTELAKLQNALSCLDKNFAEAKGQTGVFTNLLWNVGLYNYGNPNEETKKN